MSTYAAILVLPLWSFLNMCLVHLTYVVIIHYFKASRANELSTVVVGSCHLLFSGLRCLFTGREVAAVCPSYEEVWCVSLLYRTSLWSGA